MHDVVNEAQSTSLAIAESTINPDISQLCVFVQYFYGKVFEEKLLVLILLEGITTGDTIFGTGEVM